MAISKKACRVYADPGLSINRNCGLLQVEEITYILRTAVKNIAGRRTLLVYFYRREKVASGGIKPGGNLP